MTTSRAFVFRSRSELDDVVNRLREARTRIRLDLFLAAPLDELLDQTIDVLEDVHVVDDGGAW